MIIFAAIKKAEGPIPELRPPKGQIALDVPESAIFVGAIIFAFAVLLMGRILRIGRPLPPVSSEPPVARARRELAAVSGPDAFAECVQIIRRYLVEGWLLGPEGATTHELCARFAVHPLATLETSAAVESFFAESDLARFAPLDAPLGAETGAARACALLEQLEALRESTPAPEESVAT